MATFRQQIGLTAMIEGAGDPAYVVDDRGTIVSWNQAAVRFFGIPAQRAVGRACAGLVRGCGPDGEAVCVSDCPLLNSARRGRSPAATDIVVRCGGLPSTRRRVRVHHLAVADPEGRPAGLLHLLSELEECPVTMPNGQPNPLQASGESQTVPGLFLG
jgi:PAS domain-containing protein